MDPPYLVPPDSKIQTISDVDRTGRNEHGSVSMNSNEALENKLTDLILILEQV